MTLVKCPNGHYYDASRFGDNCPHCGVAGGSAQGSASEVSGDQTTVPLKPVGNTNTTQPLTSEVKDNDATIPVSADVLGGVAVHSAPVVGWLVCTESVNKGADYRLHQGRNFIGRSLDMDVCIMNDNTVSRSSHAVVVYDPRSNVYLVQPGDSKELLYVNDNLVLSTIELKAMDTISIGNTIMVP